MAILITPKPAIDLNNVPHMAIGMGAHNAYLNGYRHGFEGVNTSDICCLTRDTEEYQSWQQGYFDGERDAVPVAIPEYVYFPAVLD